MKAFEARYPGRCAACEEGFDEGTLIRYDDFDQIVHDDCDGEAFFRPEPEKACPQCHLAHKGDCW